MTPPDLGSDETKAQDDRVARAVAVERERCANIAECQITGQEYPGDTMARVIAELIRDPSHAACIGEAERLRSALEVIAGRRTGPHTKMISNSQIAAEALDTISGHG